MAVENQTIKDAASEGTALERYVNVQMGNFIHVFLTLLAVLVMAAACIALVQIVHYGFPQLWHVSDEYAVLHELLQKYFCWQSPVSWGCCCFSIVPPQQWKL